MVSLWQLLMVSLWLLLINSVLNILKHCKTFPQILLYVLLKNDDTFELFIVEKFTLILYDFILQYRYFFLFCFPLSFGLIPFLAYSNYLLVQFLDLSSPFDFLGHLFIGILLHSFHLFVQLFAFILSVTNFFLRFLESHLIIIDHLLLLADLCPLPLILLYPLSYFSLVLGVGIVWPFQIILMHCIARKLLLEFQILVPDLRLLTDLSLREST